MSDEDDIKTLLDDAIQAYNDGAKSDAGTPARAAARDRVLGSLVGDGGAGRPIVHGTEPEEIKEGRGQIGIQLDQEWDDYRANQFQGTPFEKEDDGHKVTVTGNSARAKTALKYTAPDGTQQSIPSSATLVKSQDHWRIVQARLRS